jgi:transposase
MSPIGRRIRFPWFSSRCYGARAIRESADSDYHSCAARKKKCCGTCGTLHRSFYDCTRRRVRDLPNGPFRIYLDVEVRRVCCCRCGAVKRERLDFLADNPFYTQRFAHYVGRHCRSATIKDIAEELCLDWNAVKELDKQYMRAQLKRAGTPGPKAIGIDEISIRKGHTYRIVVGDLVRHRHPIWLDGQDRSEARMDEFYRFLWEKKTQKIRLTVVDMWKPFHKLTRHHAPQAAILFVKFHVLRHLSEVLDKVRKHEYSRFEGKQRMFIKGQKYTLLTHPQNRTGIAPKNLKLLLSANQRINTAYVLKESYAQLWDYASEASLGQKILRELAGAAE